MPDDSDISFTILIAEKQTSFRIELKDILQREFEKQSDHQFKIDLVSNLNELISYNKSSTVMVFINLNLIETDFSKIETLTGFSDDTFIVLLISDEGGALIKNAIKVFNKHLHYFFDAHFLIDNYSSNILQLFCRDLIKKMILKWSQNQMK
jgi:hypothetical protein